MTPKTKEQISNASHTDAFALAALGVLLFEGKEMPQDKEKGLQCLYMAANKGILWAKDMLTLINTVDSTSNVRQNASVSFDAVRQLENYANQGNTWAETILAVSRYYGYRMSQDRTSGLAALKSAVEQGNSWAQEIYFKIIQPTSTYFTRKNESQTWSAFRHTPNVPPGTNSRPADNSSSLKVRYIDFNGHNNLNDDNPPLKF